MSFDHDPTEINALAILGADPDVRELASLEQLRTMATLAPRLRNMTEAQRARALRLESGRSTSVGEVVDSCVARAGIELDVVPLEGPKRIALCKACGSAFRPRKLSSICENYECRNPLCPCGCGKRGTANGNRKALERHGRPWQCRPSASRQREASKTPEQLSERSRKGRAALTAEQWSEIARRTMAALTPEQRSERARKAAVRRARKQRSECVLSPPEFERCSNV